MFTWVPVPEGACGRRQRRAEGPDVLFVLLRGGNADLERGDVRQKRANGRRGRLLLPLPLGGDERRKLDLDDRAGKAEHAPMGGKGESDLSSFHNAICNFLKKHQKNKIK